jgi:hypothetical protein
VWILIFVIAIAIAIFLCGSGHDERQTSKGEVNAHQITLLVKAQQSLSYAKMRPSRPRTLVVFGHRIY